MLDRVDCYGVNGEKKFKQKKELPAGVAQI